MKIPNINIVLLEPEIPQNTGNIGRTCVGLGAMLHLVGQLGFSLSEKALKRAGMDYWPNLQFKQYKNWEEFISIIPQQGSLFFLSSKGSSHLWDAPLKPPLYLVFGSESRGLPPSFYRRFKDRLVKIPMEKEARSLNLATAVGMAGYEALRQIKN